jgi:hypothetical protein
MAAYARLSNARFTEELRHEITRKDASVSLETALVPRFSRFISRRFLATDGQRLAVLNLVATD